MVRLGTQSNITSCDFQDLYPMMVFDVDMQSERVRTSSVDMKIHATLNAVVAAATMNIILNVSNDR
jgi:hypothetical protein